MGRRVPRSTVGRRRDDGRHAIADRQPRTTRRSAISILSPHAFSAQHGSRCAAIRDAAIAVNERLIALGESRKILGNSSVRRVVRLRSDSFEAPRAAACVARVARRVARCRRSAARCPRIVLDDRVLGEFGAVGAHRYWVFGAVARNRAVDLPTERRSRSIECRARRRNGRAARCNVEFDMRDTSHARKNFLREAKILAKTCCTN